MNCKIIQASKPVNERVEINKLMLNEMFMAEKDASKVSSYFLNANNIDIGKFKSSGIIISTGTGSSGWLYGAKRLSNTNVSDIAQKI